MMLYVIKCYSPKRKEVMVRDLYDDAKAEPSLMERVKEVQANLDVKFPTFVKLMIRSNVNVWFLLVRRQKHLFSILQ